MKAVDRGVDCDDLHHLVRSPCLPDLPVPKRAIQHAEHIAYRLQKKSESMEGQACLYCAACRHVERHRRVDGDEGLCRSEVVCHQYLPASTDDQHRHEVSTNKHESPCVTAAVPRS
eukprot:3602978-Rhodomonas_salina.3